MAHPAEGGICTYWQHRRCVPLCAVSDTCEARRKPMRALAAPNDSVWLRSVTLCLHPLPVTPKLATKSGTPCCGPSLMTFREQVTAAFAHRSIPAEVLTPATHRQCDSDLEETLWFTGRDWRTLTWNDWRDRYDGIFFLSTEAFAYYLQSLLCLTAENPSDSLLAAEAVIHTLDRSPNSDGWDDFFRPRYTALTAAELDCVEEWLLLLCESAAYRSYGAAAGGPGDTFGRAIDTVSLLKAQLQRP